VKLENVMFNMLLYRVGKEYVQEKNIKKNDYVDWIWSCGCGNWELWDLDEAVSSTLKTRG